MYLQKSTKEPIKKSTKKSANIFNLDKAKYADIMREFDL